MLCDNKENPLHCLKSARLLHFNFTRLLSSLEDGGDINCSGLLIDHINMQIIRSARLFITRLERASRHISSEASNDQEEARSSQYPNTSQGIKERSIKPDGKSTAQPIYQPYPPFPDGKNPKTGEVGGPGGPEPTRFGDWERKGRVTDF